MRYPMRFQRAYHRLRTIHRILQGIPRPLIAPKIGFADSYVELYTEVKTAVKANFNSDDLFLRNEARIV
jgi:hypothetical protein